jgi:hypothetical protein
MNKAAGAKPKPKFTPKAPPKKEIVEPVAAPVVVPRYTNTHELKCVILDLATVLIFVHSSPEGRFKISKRQRLGTTTGVFDSLCLLSTDLV